MCAELLLFISHISKTLLPFAVLLGFILWVTGEPKDRKASKCYLLSILRGDVPPSERSRWKGLAITLSGGTAGALVTFMKPTGAGDYQWLYESVAQTSYMFASAVAAMYIAHGYKHADPSLQKAENAVATKEVTPAHTEKPANESKVA